MNRKPKATKSVALTLLMLMMFQLLFALELKAQSTPPSVIQFLKQSATLGKEGQRFEQAGDFQNALARYEQSIQAADGALAEYQRAGIDFSKRAGVAYWLPALCHYNAARMQMALRFAPQEITQHLGRARDGYTSTINLDHANAPRGYQYTSEGWQAFYNRANILSMLGDTAGARRDYQSVLNLKKGFQPAVEQLAFLDYVEGHSRRETSPGGLKFPSLSNKQIMDVVFIFAKLVASKYKEEISEVNKLADIIVR